MGRKKKGDLTPKKIRVSYTINPDLIEKMALIAEKHGQKMSSVFEEAVENFLILVETQEQVEMIEKKPTEFKRLLRRANVESAPAHQV